MKLKRGLKIILWILAINSLLMIVFVLSANRLLGLQRVKVMSSGVQRTYLVHVPDSYDGSQPVPLVIAIHGYGGWPTQLAYGSEWNRLADEEGFIVAYPAGTGSPLHWRTSGKPVDNVDPLVDVQFISDLIDDLDNRYAIDPQRIYANGHSNGGGMSYLLWCKLSDRLAAVGSVSGAYMYPQADCQPKRTLPLIAFHGTADPIVPYLGGPSDMFDVPFVVVPDWMASQASLMGCTAEDAVEEQVGITRRTYSGCKDGSEFVFYTLDEIGHTWPGGGGLPSLIVGKNTDAIHVSEVMWAFFKAHTPQE